MKKENQKLLRVDQVAKRLNCHIKTVYDMIHAGRINSVRIGVKKGYRISEIELEKFVVDSEFDPLK